MCNPLQGTQEGTDHYCNTFADLACSVGRKCQIFEQFCDPGVEQT